MMPTSSEDGTHASKVYQHQLHAAPPARTRRSEMHEGTHSFANGSRDRARSARARSTASCRCLLVARPTGASARPRTRSSAAATATTASSAIASAAASPCTTSWASHKRATALHHPRSGTCRPRPARERVVGAHALVCAAHGQAVAIVARSRQHDGRRLHLRACMCRLWGGLRERFSK